MYLGCNSFRFCLGRGLGGGGSVQHRFSLDWWMSMHGLSLALRYHLKSMLVWTVTWEWNLPVSVSSLQTLLFFCFLPAHQCTCCAFSCGQGEALAGRWQRCCQALRQVLAGMGTPKGVLHWGGGQAVEGAQLPERRAGCRQLHALGGGAEQGQGHHDLWWHGHSAEVDVCCPEAAVWWFGCGIR